MRISRVDIECQLLDRLVGGLEVEVVTLVVGAGHDGVVPDMGVAGRPAYLVCTSGDGHVVVEGSARVPEHLLYPVVALHVLVEVHVLIKPEIRHVVILIRPSYKREFILVADEVIWAVHLYGVLVGHPLLAPVGVVAYGELAVCAALGSDEHHSVCTAGSVNGRGEGVFQHVYGLDVRGRDIGNALYRETVHYIERRTVLGDGAGTADTDLYLRVRVSLGSGHLHSCHPSGKSFRDSGHRGGGNGLAVHGRNGTYEVLPLHTRITDDHGLLKEIDILFKDDIDHMRIADDHTLRPQTDHREYKSLPLRIRDIYHIVARLVGSNPRSSAVHEHGDSHQWSPFRILDNTSDLLRLHSDCRGKPEDQHRNPVCQIIHKRTYLVSISFYYADFLLSNANLRHLNTQDI